MIKSVDQAARQYWVLRQRHATQAPTFSLKQDHPPLPTSPSASMPPIPIRLDLEADNCRLHEAFLWKPDDALLDPTKLSSELCFEFKLDRSVFMPMIQQSIVEQVQDWTAFTETKRGVSFDNIKAFIKLDIIIGNIQFTDGFVVDLAYDLQTLIGFAEQTCRELKLSAEFGPAIAFCTLEQVYQVQRALLAMGWTMNDDHQIVLNNAHSDPELVSRLNWDPTMLGPIITELTSADVERLSIVRDRDGRRKRRQTRSRRDAWALGSPAKLHVTPLGLISRSKPVLSNDNYSAGSDDTEVDDEDEVYVGRAARPLPTSTVRGGRKKRGRGGIRGRR